MSTYTHDNQCDSGQPCEMCREVNEGLSVYPDSPRAVHDTETCHCSMCRWADQQEREQPTIPTFDTDWQQAPRLVRRLITEADAEYFWRKGEQAGRIAEQVETRRWLAQVMAGYDERVSR